MAMMMMPMGLAEMAIMAISAIMATIAMANGNFSMAIRGIQLKSTKVILSFSRIFTV